MKILNFLSMCHILLISRGLHRHSLLTSYIHKQICVFKGNVCLPLLGIDGSIDVIPSSETCTKWQPVSECTVTCGGGTKDVTRTCTAKVKCNEQACRKSLNDCCYFFKVEH